MKGLTRAIFCSKLVIGAELLGMDPKRSECAALLLYPYIEEISDISFHRVHEEHTLK